MSPQKLNQNSPLLDHLSAVSSLQEKSPHNYMRTRNTRGLCTHIWLENNCVKLRLWFVQSQGTQHQNARPENHLGVWSDPWLPDVGPDGTPVGVPLSDGGPTPHFPSDSSGSNTCTPPSLRPRANWLGSTGWAAMTSGYTVELSNNTTKISNSSARLYYFASKVSFPERIHVLRCDKSSSKHHRLLC
jgi:hypothetical protein